MTNLNMINGKQNKGIYKNGKRIAGYPKTCKLKPVGTVSIIKPTSSTGGTADDAYDAIICSVSSKSIKWFSASNFKPLTTMPSTVNLHIYFAGKHNIYTLSVTADGDNYFHVSSYTSQAYLSSEKVFPAELAACITDSSGNLFCGSENIVSVRTSSVSSGTGYPSNVTFSQVGSFNYTKESLELDFPLSNDIGKSIDDLTTYLKETNSSYYTPVALSATTALYDGTSATDGNLLSTSFSTNVSYKVL